MKRFLICSRGTCQAVFLHNGCQSRGSWSQSRKDALLKTRKWDSRMPTAHHQGSGQTVRYLLSLPRLFNTPLFNTRQNKPHHHGKIVLKLINIPEIDSSVLYVYSHCGLLHALTGVFVSDLFLRQHGSLCLTPTLLWVTGRFWHCLSIKASYFKLLNHASLQTVKLRSKNLLPFSTLHTHTHMQVMAKMSSEYLNSGRMQEQGQGLGKGRGRRGEMGR